MKNVRNILILFTLAILSACSTIQQREFWFSEDGKYQYKNSAINTATYETFRPLQQYHGKQIKGIKQDGLMVSFSLQDAVTLNIKVPVFSGVSVNGVALKSKKYDSAEEEQKKKETLEALEQISLEQNKTQEVPLKKSGFFSKNKTNKDQSKKKDKKTNAYDWGQYNYKTIEWIVVLDHGVYIKFTDRTRLHISGNERCTPCINNVKYKFSECY